MSSAVVWISFLALCHIYLTVINFKHTYNKEQTSNSKSRLQTIVLNAVGTTDGPQEVQRNKVASLIPRTNFKTLNDPLQTEKGNPNETLEYMNLTHAVTQKSSGRWLIQEDGPMGIYMLNAFWDDRWNESTKPVVSILGSLQTFRNKSLPKTNLYCHWTIDMVHIESAEVTTMAAMKYTWPLLGKWYRAHVVSCDVPADIRPQRITLSYSMDYYGRNLTELNSVPVVYPDHDPKYTFGVCVPLSFGRIDPHRIVEWMELQKILGVSWVGIHNYNLEPDSLKVMEHYAREGFVDLRENGALFAENNRDEIRIRNAVTEDDCIYRHMYNTKYILVIDLDEVIVPTHSQNLYDMMQVLEHNRTGKFPFREANFMNYYIRMDDRLANNSVDASQNITFFRHRHRTRDTHPMQTKSIINPLGCVHMDNHRCHVGIDQYKAGAPYHQRIWKVPRDIGRLLHYRVDVCHMWREKVHCLWGVDPSLIYKENVMTKYEVDLKNNVQNSLRVLEANKESDFSVK